MQTHSSVIENFIREGKGGKGTYVKATDDVLSSKIPQRYAPFGYRPRWRDTAEGQTAQLAVRLKDGSILTNGARFDTPIDMHQEEIMKELERAERRFTVEHFH